MYCYIVILCPRAQHPGSVPNATPLRTSEQHIKWNESKQIGNFYLGQVRDPDSGLMVADHTACHVQVEVGTQPQDCLWMLVFSLVGGEGCGHAFLHLPVHLPGYTN
jgi:hypothetical protein